MDNRRCSLHRFSNLAKVVDDQPVFFPDYEYYKREEGSLHEGKFFMIWIGDTGKKSDYFCLDSFLVDACSYEDGSAHVMAIKRKHSGATVRFPTAPRPRDLDGIGVAAFFTDTHPYRDFVKPFVDHYAGLGMPICFSLAWYSDGAELPVDLPEGSSVQSFPLEKFNEAHANNACLSGLGEIGCSHFLKLDGDTSLTIENINSLKATICSTANDGIINIKHDEKTGPGLLFGEIEVVRRNHFSPEFPGFYHADTEFFLNFSRLGIVPQIKFMDFDRAEHDRPRMGNFEENYPVLHKIVNQGRSEG